MRPSFALLAFAAGMLSADAIHLNRRATPRVVQHDIQRRSVSNPLERDRLRLARRSGTVSASLLNEETLYFLNATLGTPAQDFEFHIDTGSSDLWVNVASSQFCEKSVNMCSETGLYSPNSSSTYKYVNSGFNISYDDGSGAAGDYATDTFTFSTVTLQNQQFGIGYVSSTAQGVMGIGYPLIEAEVTYDDGRSYANVPAHLLQNGDIAANAYSLWLNDLEASTGNILFGGVNSAKYTGDLETVPILKEGGVYAQLVIALTGVGINGSAGSVASNIAVPAVLDSGTSLTYLPDDIAESIYSSFGVSYNSGIGAAYVPCSMAQSKATIDFTFSSPTISVAMRELVIVIEVNSRGQQTCIMGIGKAGNGTPLLGDTFLRSAYVVYDLTANEISLAQTDFNSTRTDDIQEISSAGAIPGATPVANPVTTVQVNAGGARVTDVVTGTLRADARPTAAVANMNLALVGAIGAGVAFAL